MQSATVVQLLDYYPYGGNRLNEKSGGFDEQRKFSNHEYDQDTGLNYMNARYYNSNYGSFISEDPVFLGLGGGQVASLEEKKKFNSFLSDPQQLNSYSYAKIILLNGLIHLGYLM